MLSRSSSRVRDAHDSAGGGGSGGGGGKPDVRSSERPVFAHDAAEGLADALGFEPTWVEPGAPRRSSRPDDGSLPPLQPLAVRLFLAYRRTRKRYGLPGLDDIAFLAMMGRMVGYGYRNLWGAQGGTYAAKPEGSSKPAKTQRRLMTFLDLLSVVLAAPSGAMTGEDAQGATTLRRFEAFLKANGCYVTHGAKPTLGALAWMDKGDRCHANPDVVGFHVGDGDARRWFVFPAQPLPRRRDGATVWDLQWGEGSEGIAEAGNELFSYLGMLYTAGVERHFSFDRRGHNTLMERLKHATPSVVLSDGGYRDIKLPADQLLIKDGKRPVCQVQVRFSLTGHGLKLCFLDAEGKVQHTTRFFSRELGDEACVSSEDNQRTWSQVLEYVREVEDAARMIGAPEAPVAANCSEGQNRSAALLIQQAMRRDMKACPSDAPGIALWALRKIQEHSKRVGIKPELTKQWMNLAVAAYTFLPLRKRPQEGELMRTLWALQVVATSVSGASNIEEAMTRLLGSREAQGKLSVPQSGSTWFPLFQESFDAAGAADDAVAGDAAPVELAGFDNVIRSLTLEAWRFEVSESVTKEQISDVFSSVLDSRSFDDLLPSRGEPAAEALASAEGESGDLWWAEDAATGGVSSQTRMSAAAAASGVVGSIVPGAEGRELREAVPACSERSSSHAKTPAALSGGREAQTPVDGELGGFLSAGDAATGGAPSQTRVPAAVAVSGVGGVQGSEHASEDGEEGGHAFLSQPPSGGSIVPGAEGRELREAVPACSERSSSHAKTPAAPSSRWVVPLMTVGIVGMVTGVVLYRMQTVTQLPMVTAHAVFFAGLAVFGLTVLVHLVLRQRYGRTAPKLPDVGAAKPTATESLSSEHAPAAAGRAERPTDVQVSAASGSAMGAGAAGR